MTSFRLQIHHPDELPSLLAASEIEVEGAETAAALAWNDVRELLERERHSADIFAREQEELICQRAGHEIRALQDEVDRITSRRRWGLNPVLVVWMGLTWWRMTRVRNRRYRRVAEAHVPLRQANFVLKQHERQRSDFINGRVNAAARKRDVLRRITQDGQLAGLRAEQEALDALRRLPDTWHVFNNAQAEAHDWIRFNGTYLRSAQIDHLVVGPGGVFVIETKRWSQAFASSGEGFCPYEQVRRASYLCHRLLKNHGIKVPVRSLICSDGSLPPKPSDSFAKVLAGKELCGYIRWFEHEINETDIHRMVRIIERW